MLSCCKAKFFSQQSWTRPLIHHSQNSPFYLLLTNKYDDGNYQIGLKSIHWVNSFARSSFFEKHIILTKPFQPARADISCSFFEKHIIVQNFLLSEWALTLAIWLSIPGGGHRCLSGQDGVIFNHKNPGRVPFGKGICRQLCLLTPPSAIYGTGKEILSVNFRTPKVQLCIKVSRSQNMKRKIYEILTSPKCPLELVWSLDN